jgi:agmatine deiminase
MNPHARLAILLPLCGVLTACGPAPGTGDTDTGEREHRRVPAEWETHAATWMQWPGPWEASMRPAFAEIVRVVQAYEPMHLLVSTAADQTQAQQLLAEQGVSETDISWHVVATDNAWMRDNGPIYAEVAGELRVLDFGFDAWGGNFGGHIPYGNDDVVPAYVATSLGLSREDHGDYILERGNLELNGAGLALLSWDCQDDRNPGMSEAEHEAILGEALGLERIIWAYGHHPSDGTTGHIDGYARFVSEDTVAIGQTTWGTETEEALVAACEQAGLTVVRIPGPGDTDYMNWLEGNGFVAGMRFGDAEADTAAQALLESLFPDRDVHMIDATTLWAAGGGVHCVTNDQPAS